MGTNLIKYIQDINKSFFKDKDYKKIDNLVTELHMHKILFFLYGAYWKKFHKELFKADFEAWKYGPVEINYRNYKNDDARLNNYFFFNPSKLPKEEKEYLDATIEKLLKVSAIDLVEASHLTNVWSRSYSKNGKRLKMKNADIQNDFIKTINI